MAGAHVLLAVQQFFHVFASPGGSSHDATNFCVFDAIFAHSRWLG
jgi:hypothetical protein